MIILNPRRRALVSILAAGLTLAGAGAPARAAVFDNTVKWPAGSRGYVNIHVCVEPDSSAVQKAYGSDAGLFHDPNPSLDEVVHHMRKALANTWERHSAVRFVGWETCNNPPTTTVRLTVHPDVDVNDASVGFVLPPEANIRPWGNSFNSCIVYDGSTTRMRYDFDCAEQYAIHEFGHVLGLLHEWSSPAKPDGCGKVERRTYGGPPLCQTQGTTPGVNECYIPNPTSYDWNSIMTYDSECADVTGVRFGSPVPTATDYAAVAAVYPRPITGSYDVGVLAGPEGCGDRETITFYMDDEDSDNQSYATGWTGASRSGDNTTLSFCRADGALFGKPPATMPGLRNGDYSVLRLGPFCPPGSVAFSRRIDNEDHRNQNFVEGSAAPSLVNAGGTSSTLLSLCLFKPENSGGQPVAQFPVLGMSYGVLAPPDFAYGLAHGRIYTDDEDDGNADALTCPDALSQIAAGRMIGGASNTTIEIARVR